MNGACGFPAHRSPSRTLERKDTLASSSGSGSPPLPVGAIAGFGLAFALGLLSAALSYQRQVFGIRHRVASSGVLHHSLGVTQLGPNKTFVGIDGMEHRAAAIGLGASALRQALPHICIALHRLLSHEGRSTVTLTASRTVSLDRFHGLPRDEPHVPLSWSTGLPYLASEWVRDGHPLGAASALFRAGFEFRRGRSVPSSSRRIGIQHPLLTCTSGIGTSRHSLSPSPRASRSCPRCILYDMDHYVVPTCPADWLDVRHPMWAARPHNLPTAKAGGF